MQRALPLLLIAIWGCAKPAQFHPRVGELPRVAIMPPDVSVVLINYTAAPQPLDQQSSIVRRDLPRAIAPALQRRGFTVVPARLGESDLTAYPDVRDLLTTTQGRCNGVAVAYLRGDGVPSLGPDVEMLAEHVGADALLCVAYVRKEKSEGQIVSETLSNVVLNALTLGRRMDVPQNMDRLFVALVDETTGDVHWSHALQRGSLPFENPSLDALVDELFEPMPMRPSSTAPAA